MKTRFVIVFLFISFSIGSLHAQLSGLPSSQEMEGLRPENDLRLRLYDGLFTTTAYSADQTHQFYTNAQALTDIEQRLQNVRLSGDPQDIFSPQERLQFEKNMKELRKLEADYFAQLWMKVPMNVAIRLQKWITQINSPEPQGPQRETVLSQLKAAHAQNHLYQNWHKYLPAQWIQPNGPQTWGDLLLRFSQDLEFREAWIQSTPQSLAELKALSQIWAWEDSAVRSVTIYESSTPREHWVLQRQERTNVPNRFEMNLAGDFEGLVRSEYAPTVFFNRVSKVLKTDTAITFFLESLEKGRTMELSPLANENGTSKRTFFGAEMLRKTKVDEFIQREYVQKGSLNLFLGLRSMQLNQIQELMKLHPELVLAVSQFGFSVTGGRAQTVSRRTDSPQQQLLKLTATLIDFVEFARTTNVKNWFEQNKKHVLRTILGGVGSGGSQALKEPTSQKIILPPTDALQNGLRCLAVFQRTP